MKTKVPKQKPKDYRINIPLTAPQKEDLRSFAKAMGLTETAVARVLILDGLDRIKAGKVIFRAPSVEEVDP